MNYRSNFTMTLERTTIGQLMSERLETIDISSSAQKASQKMRDKNISSLVVIDNDKRPTGIVTERDLVRKVCVNDASSSNTQIKDIMSSSLLTIDAGSSIGEAADIMIQKRVRHLLVVEDDDVNKPLGLITPSDFAGYLRENLDIDDVNAKILQSMQEEREEQQKTEESKSNKKAIANDEVDPSQQKWPGT